MPLNKTNPLIQVKENKTKDTNANITLFVKFFVFKLFGIATKVRLQRIICSMMVMAQVIGTVFGFGTVNLSNIFSVNTAHAATGINKTINYQGKLMDASGNLVADGDYDMIFVIYDSATAGNQLWSASTTNGLPTGTTSTLSVTVSDGLFSILLGDESTDQVAFPANLFNNDELYLGVTIGADSEMTPRKRLSAVPYAFNSEMLQGQYASSSDLGDDATLFALNQASSSAPYTTRTALYIESQGLSNSLDFLIRANNGTDDVFSISRQGNVTTTGNLQVDGATDLNGSLAVAATSSLFDLSLSGRVNSNLLPYITDTYSLGNSTYRWLGITAQNVNTVNVSSTNIDALGYVSTTNLYVDGVQITGDIPNLDQVTDEGNITTNAIGVGGVSSTGNILPTQTLTYDLGSSARRWKDIWVSSTYIGDNTWNLRQDANDYFNIADVGGFRRLTINTSGNVGINSSAPSAILEINDQGLATADELAIIESSANSAANIKFTNTARSWSMGADSSPDVFYIDTFGGTQNIFNINPSGQVGLGTYSINQRLQVGDSGSNINEGIRVTSNRDAFIEIIADVDNVNEDDNPYIFFSQDAGVNVRSTIGFTGNANVDSRGDAYSNALDNAFLIGNSFNGPTQFGSNGTVRITILGDGNVGIGTNAPGESLDIAGNFRHTGNMISYGGTYAHEWMQFNQDVNGNSLILGSGALTVLGAGESMDQAKANLTASQESLYLTSDGDIQFVTGLQSGWASRVDAMTILTAGNVGIGTTNPASFKLQVAGNVGPNLNNIYNLGSPTLSWNGLYVSGTTAFNTVAYTWPSSQGGANTFLRNDGSGNLTWQAGGGGISGTGTDNHIVRWDGTGNVQDSAIVITDAGHVLPTSTLAYDLGSSSYRWRDIWASSTRIGTSTWDIWQSNRGFTLSNNNLANPLLTLSNGGNLALGDDHKLDHFNNSSIETYWTTSTPAGTITESGEELTMTCSGTCDWWSGALEQAPIIYQDLAYSGDFTVVTKINSFTPSNGNTNAGITIYLDRNNAYNWVRDGDNLIYGWSVIADSGSDLGISTASSDMPVWLRVRRVNTTLYFDYSTDGVTFTNVGSTVQSITPTKVGLLNKTWADATLTTTFEYFDVSYPNQVVNSSSAFEFNGAMTWNGFTGPGLSGANKGIIFYDAAANKFRASENGGAYVDLLSGAVDLQEATDNGNITTNWIQFAGGTSTGSLFVKNTLGINTSTSDYLFAVQESFVDTTDVTGSGTATALSTSNGMPADRAFDNLTTDWQGWFSDNYLPQWLKYDFGAGNEKVISGYSLLYNDPWDSYHPRDWQFQGSNNDSDWVTLDSRSAYTWTAGQKRTFDFHNLTAYRYYRIYITADNNGSYNYVSINEVEMFEAEPGSNYFTVDYSGNLVSTASTTLNNLTLTGSINSNLLPYITDTYSMGSYDTRWRSIYGNITATGFENSYSVTTTVLSVAGRDLDRVGNYVFIAGETSFLVYDVSDKTNPTLVGSVGLVNGRDVQVIGDYAYVLDGNGASGGFKVINISDPASPFVAGSINNICQADATYGCRELVVKDQVAYAVLRDNGLIAIDISNPSSPVELDRFDTGAMLMLGLDVSGNYAYTANGNSGPALEIYNISDPTDIQYVTGISTNLTNAFDVVVKDGYAYVSDAGTYVEVFDVRNPSSPTHVTTITDAANIGDRKMQIVGNLFFGNGGYIYDISSSTNPVLLSSASFSGTYFDADGGYIYGTNGETTATSFYITRLPGIEALWMDASNMDVYNLFTVNGKTILGSTTSSKTILNGYIGSDIIPYQNNYYSLGSSSYKWLGLNASNVTTDNLVAENATTTNLAADYVTTSELWVGGTQITGAFPTLQQVTDSGNTTNDSIEISAIAPVPAGKIQDNTYLDGAYDIRIVGDIAYTISYDSDYFVSWDVSDPENPVRLGSYANASYTDGAYNFEIKGNYAYVASVLDNRLTVLNISDPANITLAGFLASNNGAGIYLDGAYAVKIKDDYAYVVSQEDDALEIIDISNPTAPAHVASVLHNGTTIFMDQPQALAISGNYVYVTGRTSDSVQVFDISNPASPVAKGSLRDTTCVGGASACGLIGPGGIEVVGNYAYIAGYDDNAFTVVDISSSTNPVNVGYLADNASTELNGAWDVQIYENYALVAGFGDSGFEMIDISSSTNPLHFAAVADTADTYLSNASAVAVRGDYIYVTSRNENGLQVLRLNSRIDSFVGEIDSLSSKQIYTTNLFASNDIVAKNDFLVRKNAMINGKLTLGSTATMRDILPASNNLYDLGSSSLYWNDIFVNNVNTSNLTLAPSTPTEYYSVDLNANLGVQAIEVIGNIVYLATDDSNGTLGKTGDDFQILDITNPDRPVYLGGLDLGSNTYFAIHDIEIVGNIAYIAGRDMVTSLNYELLAVDITDPYNPQVITGVNLFNAATHPAYTVKASNNYLYIGGYYLASGNYELLTFDISDPSVLELLGGKALTYGIYTMDLIGDDYLVIGTATGESGDEITLYDLSNPVSPTRTGGISLGDSAVSGLQVRGSTVYAATFNQVSYGSRDFFILDASSSTNVTVTGSLEVASAALQSIVLAEDYAYVLQDGAAGNEILIINIASSTNPTYVSGYNIGDPSTANDLALSGRTLLVGVANVTGSNKDLYLLNIGGLNTFAADIGSLWAGKLNVAKDAVVGSDLYVKNDIFTGNVFAQYLKSHNIFGEEIIGRSIATEHPSNEVLTAYGPLALGGTGYDVAIQGRYAYVNRASTYLQIYDLTNFESPVLLKQVAYSVAGATHLEVQGDYVYSVGGGRLYVMDVSDPGNATEVFTGAVFSNTTNDLKIRGHYLYAAEAAGTGGINIFDITNPASPTLVKKLTLSTTSNWSHIYVDGTYAYMVANDSSRFAIVDITDPFNPVEKYNATTNISGPNEIVVKGRYAYIGNNTSLRIFDISSSTNPFLAKTISNPTYSPAGLRVEGDYVYTVQSSGRYSIFNVKDVANAYLVSQQQIPSVSDSLVAIDISGRYAVIVGGSNLRTLDLKGADFTSLTAHSAETGSLNVLTDAIINNQLTVRGGISSGAGGIYSNGPLTAYATSAFMGKVGIGTITPNNFSLQVAGHVGPNANNTYDLGSSTYKWRNVYTNDLTTGDLNISPRTPTYVSGINMGWINAVDVSGKYAYVGHNADGTYEFSIIDVSDAKSPKKLGQLDIGGNDVVYDVEAVGQYAYIAQTSDDTGSKEIQLIDVSNPNAPFKVSGVDTPASECYDVLVSGNYVYAACNNVTDSVADLYIIDYTNKNSPLIATSTNFTAGAAHALEKKGDYLIIGTQNATNYMAGADILIFNVANPYLATFVGGYDTGSNNVESLTLQGNLLFAGSQNAVSGYEFMIFDVSNPASIVYKGGVDLYNSYNVVGIQAGGEYVYALQQNGVGGGTDLHIINITSTTAPTIINSSDLGASTMYDMKLDGTKLYVGVRDSIYSSQDFLIMDVSGVTTPSADIGSLFAVNMNVAEDATFNKNVYINSGLTVGDFGINTFGPLSVATSSKFLDIMQTSNIRPLANNTYDLGTSALRFKDSYFSGTVETKPTTGVRLGGYNVGTTYPVYATFIKDNYLYVGTRNETITGRNEDFQIYDISDPNNPRYLSGVDINIFNAIANFEIKVVGTYAYLIKSNDSNVPTLYVYDVADPYNIVLQDSVGFSSSNNGVHNMAIFNGYVFAAGHDSGTTLRLYTVDVNDPANISIVDTLSLTGGYHDAALNVHDGKLYMGTSNLTTYGGYDFVSFSLDNPAKPQYIGGGNISTDRILDMYFTGDRAYVGTNENKVYIVNISSSTAPAILSTINVGTQPIRDVLIMDKYLVAGTLNSGTGNANEVLVYDVSSSTNVGAPDMEINVGGSTVYEMALYGKNLVIGTLNATVNNEDIQIYDLDGIKAQAADIGSIRTNLLRVTEDLFVGNNTYVSGGLFSDMGGLHTNGALTVKSTSTFSNLQTTGRVNSNWLPYLDNTYDLGNSTYRWRNLQAVNATFTSLYVSNGALTNAFVQNGNTFGAVARLGTNDNYNLQFETNGTIKMILTTAGNLDIGDGMIGSPRGDTSILLTRDGADAFLETYSGTESEGLIMRGDGTNDYGIVRQLGGGGYASGWGEGLHIFTSNKLGVDDPIIFTTGGFERMRIGETGNFYPSSNNMYDFGLATNSWKNIYVSGTTAFNSVEYTWPGSDASGLLRSDGSGNLSWDTATYLTSGDAFIQNGNSFTANAVLGTNDSYTLSFETGGTSRVTINTSGHVYPVANNTYDLGLSTNRWNNIWGATIHIGTSTWDLTQAANGNFTITKSGFNYGTIWDNGDNLTFGYRAGEALLSGQRNVGYGSHALSNNEYGNDNTAIGYNTLSCAGCGESNFYNTAVGSNSMSNIETGSYNTALGAGSLLSLTTGATNTAVGFESLYSLTEGTGNVALGPQVFHGMTSGEGNIGIGIQSGYSMTDAEGNIALGIRALYTNGTGNNNLAIGNDALYYNLAGGNHAIGSSALRKNTTGTKNTAVGSGAGYQNETGSNNTSLGYNALYGGTGSNSYNTAVGSNSLFSITTGASNTAVGFESLYSNITGRLNTALGIRALSNNSDGNYNIAVGNYSLYNNQTGDRNTAIGSYALTSLLSGDNNTILGASAGIDMATGTNNTAVGFSVLNQFKEGIYNTALGSGALSQTGFIPADAYYSYNTAVGGLALNANFTGASNTAVGYESLYSNTTGYKNTAIGMSALQSNSSGFGNVAMGSEALQTNSTGINNTAIGSQAMQYSTISNLTAVGGGALRNNSTGSGNTGIGLTAGYFNQTGEYNTSLGYQALRGVTGNSNSYNTGIGAKSLFGLTTGASNTAVGYESLLSNTTGYENVAIGIKSLNSLSAGYWNTAVGSHALENYNDNGSVAIGAYALGTITGGQNTAVGFSALYNTSGSNDDNTALGYFAGYSNSTGNDNTYIGHQAGYAGTMGGDTAVGSGAAQGGSVGSRTAVGHNALNTGGSGGAVAIGASAGYALLSTGLQFVAVGESAGRETTSGDYDTFVGHAAGQYNTTGHSNTAVGSESLNKNDSGSYNSAFGRNALQALKGGDHNTAIGAVAGYNVTSTADYNTALGSYSLFGNTTAFSTGDYNTALGYYTLFANSTGNRNVAVGAIALTNNTTGYQNSALGTDAMQQNTSGYNNVAFGFEASQYNETGISNVALGVNALKGVSGNNHSANTAVGGYTLDAITTGYGNSALGYGALSNLTSPSYNTAMGINAGNGITTGTSNAAFGYYAGENIGTGNYNIAIGYNALEGADSDINSDYNVAIGYEALSNLTDTAQHNVGIGYNSLIDVTTGDYNVAMGYYSGDNITTLYGNTFLGYNARASGNYYNSMALGYGAQVTADNYVQIGNGSVERVTIGVDNTSATDFYYGGSLQDYSDERLKENIVDNELGLNLILALRPVHFNMKTGGYREDGLIAQEVETALNAIDEEFNGLRAPAGTDEFYTLTYDSFIGPLINAIQELHSSSSPFFTGMDIDSNFTSLGESFLSIDTDGNLAHKGATIKSQGTASTSTTAYGSYTFSFMGSAWDLDLDQEISPSFNLSNNTISATSSEFTLVYSTGTAFNQKLLTITNLGDVTVSGDLHVGRRLYLGSKTTGESSTSTYIFVDDTLSPTSTYISTNADGWQSEDAYDYAERFESDDDLTPGDIVTADPTGVNKVKRASSAGQALLGIVSTKPGFVTGRHYEGHYPIALAGRVPTRVSTANGAIQVGDYLTASDIPGVAVKAVSAGNVIGIALESYGSLEEGLISVFVKPSFSLGSIAKSGESAGTIINNTTIIQSEAPGVEIEGLALIKAGATEVHISYGTILHYPMVYVTPHASINGSWWITNRTDQGFDIVITEPQTHDMEFTWLVRPMRPGTIRFVSDNTYQGVDDLTGQPIGPYPEDPIIPTSTDSDYTTTTATDVTDSASASSTSTSVSSTDTQESDAAVSSVDPVNDGDTVASGT